MSYYVLTNPEKERLAKEAIKNKGNAVGMGYRANPQTGEVKVAHCALYFRALEENPKISEEDLLLYIYRGLGGRVEEYATQEEADKRAESLQTIRIKQARKDAV